MQPLEPVHVKFLSLHVDVRELDRAKLTDPQTMPKHEEQHAIVGTGLRELVLPAPRSRSISSWVRYSLRLGLLNELSMLLYTTFC